MAVLVTSELGGVHILEKESRMLHLGAEHAHLAQESEQRKKGLGRVEQLGVVGVCTAASQRWGDEVSQQSSGTYMSYQVAATSLWPSKPPTGLCDPSAKTPRKRCSEKYTSA